MKKQNLLDGILAVLLLLEVGYLSVSGGVEAIFGNIFNGLELFAASSLGFAVFVSGGIFAAVTFSVLLVCTLIFAIKLVRR